MVFPSPRSIKISDESFTKAQTTYPKTEQRQPPAPLQPTKTEVQPTVVQSIAQPIVTPIQSVQTTVQPRIDQTEKIQPKKEENIASDELLFKPPTFPGPSGKSEVEPLAASQDYTTESTAPIDWEALEGYNYEEPAQGASSPEANYNSSDFAEQFDKLYDELPLESEFIPLSLPEHVITDEKQEYIPGDEFSIPTVYLPILESLTKLKEAQDKTNVPHFYPTNVCFR